MLMPFIPFLTDNPQEKDENKPIYQGAHLTVAASMLLIITFVMRHGLTGAALSDLLVLVELHCISPNLFRKSVELFHQYFKHLRAPIEFHYYCNQKKCKFYLGKSKPELCPACHSSVTGKGAVSYFVVVPVLVYSTHTSTGMCICIMYYMYTDKEIKLLFWRDFQVANNKFNFSAFFAVFD